MKRSAKCKCVHCSELFLSDFRNRGRQLYCAKPECRKVARRSSQQRWLAKVENQNYGGRKIALGSGSGGRGIRATGAKRSLRPAMRYKKAAVRNMLQIRRLRLQPRPMRYKNSASCNPRCL